jgi:3-isopropylmalate/(R)-2-methylmalate dehydratase large subunit
MLSLASLQSMNRSLALPSRIPQSCFDKIWHAHTVHSEQGHPTILAVDFMFLHEVTSAQAFDVLRQRGLPVINPERLLATIDHSIPTDSSRLAILDSKSRAQVAAMRDNASQHGITIKDFGSGQGIVHVIGPELGITQPGMTVVCGDSHTATHGAFGCLAFGIGSSEIAHVLATGCLLQSRPKTMHIQFINKLQHGVYAKDLILYVISKIGIGGATGHVIEYSGECISAMSMEERMTICNMSIECGARAGLISPDITTIEYLCGRSAVAGGEEFVEASDRWLSFASDPGCTYDTTISIDCGEIEPMVTWGTNPGQGCGISRAIPYSSEATPALSYQGLHAGNFLNETPINWAFLGSCTNGRIEDLRIAASILKGRKIHSDVTCYVVPGSEHVHEQAVNEGLADIFSEAGALFRLPGCSLCLGMSPDRVPAGERCISSSNRNFTDRQGKGSRTHLASPATVIASAIMGRICDPRDLLAEDITV